MTGSTEMRSRVSFTDECVYCRQLAFVWQVAVSAAVLFVVYLLPVNLAVPHQKMLHTFPYDTYDKWHHQWAGVHRKNSDKQYCYHLCNSGNAHIVRVLSNTQCSRSDTDIDVQTTKHNTIHYHRLYICVFYASFRQLHRLCCSLSTLLLQGRKPVGSTTEPCKKDNDNPQNNLREGITCPSKNLWTEHKWQKK